MDNPNKTFKNPNTDKPATQPQFTAMGHLLDALETTYTKLALATFGNHVPNPERLTIEQAKEMLNHGTDMLNRRNKDVIDF